MLSEWVWSGGGSVVKALANKEEERGGSAMFPMLEGSGLEGSDADRKLKRKEPQLLGSFW